jgi:uncharacterized membrane protein HdeD (DUF308 family)
MITRTNRYFYGSFEDELIPGGHEALRRVAGSSIAIGVLLLVLGVAAIAHIFAATVVSVYLLGALLLAGAISWGMQAFSERRWTTALGDTFACLLYLVAGLAALRAPIMAAGAFTLVIAALFTIVGALRIVSSLTIRPVQWGWSLFNGVVTLALGLFVFEQWPLSSLWLIGTLIGVDMILGGWTALFGGFALNRLASDSARSEKPPRQAVSA